jgi:hypothetical protein
MAVEYPYTSEDAIIALAGQLAIDLRTDDVPDLDAHMEAAIDTGTSDLDFYLADYSQAGIADSTWATTHATWFAIRWLCLHRLNDLPESVKLECERREKQLELVRQRKAKAPRLAKSRRPATVSNYHVDQRKFNNQVRVDKSRSTGVAQDYRRVVDDTATDER